MARSRLFLKIVILLILQSVPSALFAAPTSVTKTQDLDFGKIAGGSGYSGTVTIDGSGARSFSGSILLLGTLFSPAGFTISGNPGKAYTLTLPTSFTINSGADQMSVSALTASIPTTGTIPVNGALTFTVGGTLVVNSAQQNSTYNGSLVISVR